MRLIVAKSQSLSTLKSYCSLMGGECTRGSTRAALKRVLWPISLFRLYGNLKSANAHVAILDNKTPPHHSTMPLEMSLFSLASKHDIGASALLATGML